MSGIEPKVLKIVQRLRGELSFWDSLHKIGAGAETAFLYGKVFWPDLVEVDGFVLLAENYDPDYLAQVLREYGPSAVEATIPPTSLIFSAWMMRNQRSTKPWGKWCAKPGKRELSSYSQIAALSRVSTGTPTKATLVSCLSKKK